VPWYLVLLDSLISVQHQGTTQIHVLTRISANGSDFFKIILKTYIIIFTVNEIFLNIKYSLFCEIFYLCFSYDSHNKRL